MLDLTGSKGAHIDRRLRGEPIIWLSTVRPDGRPHLVPVWFLWDGATILIFSKPAAQKMRNLRHSPQVMLALDTADEGEDVVLLEGRAELLRDDAPRSTLPEYAAKYAALMTRIGITAESMAAEFTQAIRVTIDRLVRFY
ncbi:MAG TPA: TIGR03667 family PPOX class F420-dependent oxidoreductase [Roseiflexaceae bacterium]|nr:TIGR03667 family PPOX class F420-dependent oxidoreductase [Roseiflexaceae bacterium]